MSFNLLIVDDSSSMRSVVKKIVDLSGVGVNQLLEAENGRRALEVLGDNWVDAVILDINMPEMNGMAFLRELNKIRPASNVIMITAYGEVESYIEAMNLGAFEYINKPVKIDELKRIIAKVFKKG